MNETSPIKSARVLKVVLNPQVGGGTYAESYPLSDPTKYDVLGLYVQDAGGYEWHLMDYETPAEALAGLTKVAGMLDGVHQYRAILEAF